VIGRRVSQDGQTVVHLATLSDSSPCLVELLQHGANAQECFDIKIIERCRAKEPGGDTALHLAAAAGATDALATLLEANVLDVDVKGRREETPWLRAMHGRQTEAMRLLEQAGADPRAVDRGGRNAMDVALRGKDVDARGNVRQVAAQLQNMSALSVASAVVRRRNAFHTPTLKCCATLTGVYAQAEFWSALLRRRGSLACPHDSAEPEASIPHTLSKATGLRTGGDGRLSTLVRVSSNKC